MADNSAYSSTSSAGARAAAQNSETLPSGYRLSNQKSGRSYQLNRVLGQGGFGITYAGINLSNRMPVAIKEFFPRTVVNRAANHMVTVAGESASFQTMLNSFFKEAKVLYSLQGLSSVVKIYDYFYANNTAYYVMEYVTGETLQHYIGKHGLLNVVAWSQPYRKLMRDIDQLHKNGVIHRDISPDNIMICSDGSLKLIDFGSARAFENQVRLTVSLKREFAPIEQYGTKGQGAFTDVYSLAATMYYTFTGKLIPHAPERQNSDRLQPPSALGIKLGQKQEKALLKALAVNPDDRFQSMQEFEQAFFDTLSVSPASDSRTERKIPQPSGGFAEELKNSAGLLMQEPLLPAISGVLLLVALLMQLVL